MDRVEDVHDDVGDDQRQAGGGEQGDRHEDGQVERGRRPSTAFLPRAGQAVELPR